MRLYNGLYDDIDVCTIKCMRLYQKSQWSAVCGITPDGLPSARRIYSRRLVFRALWPSSRPLSDAWTLWIVNLNRITTGQSEP